MAIIKYEVRFLPTSREVSNSDGIPVKIGGKVYKNIRNKAVGGVERYTFSGPNALDLGDTNLASNIKNAEALFSDKIDRWLNDYKSPGDKFELKILGHSRGGVASTRTCDNLRRKYKDHSDVEIKLCASDPYAGPTHSGKDVDLDLKPPADSQGVSRPNDDIVFYSMGTSVPCSPQKIMNAKAVVICRAGHNKTYNYMLNILRNTAILKYLDQGGVYVVDSPNFKPPYHVYRVTERNLRACMEDIYSWEKSYAARTRVLTEVIVKKLGLSLDCVLEKDAVREWKPALNNALINIGKSKSLSGAFGYVSELFSDKLFGPYVNKQEKFFKCVSEAEKFVTGIGNNNYVVALNKLGIITHGEPQKSYQWQIADALIKRIRDYYKNDIQSENCRCFDKKNQRLL